MPSPLDAYRSGYEKAKTDRLGGIAAEVTMGMLRDDPGGHFQKGYSDGAAGRPFNPPSIPAPNRLRNNGLIPKFSENPFGWFLGVLIVVELWVLWQLIKAPFQLVGSLLRRAQPSPSVIVRNAIVAGLPIALVWWVPRVNEMRAPASYTPAPQPTPPQSRTQTPPTRPPLPTKDQQANQAQTPTLTRLTTDPSRDTFPVWSPNGKILFQSNRNSGRANANDIWEMNPDGSGQRDIVRVIVSTPAQWGDPGLGGGIQVLGLSGNIAVYEAQHFHEIMQVALSTAPALPIIRTAVDGNDEYFTQLLQIPGGQSASNIVFSNATQMAAWVATVPGQGIEIRAGELSGMHGQPSSAYGSRLAAIAPNGSVQGMTYSPNGSQLAAAICWRDCAGGSHGPDLYILDSHSGQVVRQLTNTGASGAANSSPQWSPNGDWIVFTSTAAGQAGLWVTTADGSGSPPARIDTGNMQSHDASWSRDGFKIVFVGATDGNQDIWLAENLLPRR